MEDETYGKKLAAIMDECGITSPQLAAEAKATARQIRRWRQDDARVTPTLFAGLLVKMEAILARRMEAVRKAKEEG